MNFPVLVNLRFIAVLCALVCIFSVAAFSSDPSPLEAALQAKYVGKAFTLRNFYADDHLHYDGKGNAFEVHPGSWTTSMILIKRAKVSAKKVELAGSRLVEIYDTKQSKFVPVSTKLGMLLTVDRDATQSDATLMDAIDRIFLGNNEHLLDLAPAYWKVFLSGAWERVPQEDGTDCHRIKGELRQTPNGELVMTCEEKAKTKSPLPAKAGIDVSSLPYYVYGLRNSALTAPRVIFEPSPEYPGVARSLKFEGKVLLEITITAAGTTSEISIVKPIGSGLDDQAVNAVKTWLFKPAMLNDSPVAVRADVEVPFRML